MEYTKTVFESVPGYLACDRDFVVLVGGYEGSGKSTLGILLAKAACKNFDIKKDVLYSFKDLIERLKTVPKYHALVLDEAVEFAFSRNAMKREQKKIIQVFMQVRQKNLCFIMLIPNIMDIDKYFREHRAARWFEVVSRGQFLAHEKIKDIYKGKVFWQQKYRDTFEPLDSETWFEYIEVKKEAFSRRVKQKKPNKQRTWPHICPKCEYEWQGKQNPKRCPACSKRLVL
jgi:rubrerythrin